MNEMVERVAKVLSETPYRAADGQIDLRILARAAIEELREPTEAMVGRGYEAMDGYGYAEPKACWRNMIDEALQNR